MKIPTLACCLAGVLVTGVGASPNSNAATSRTTGPYVNTDRPVDGPALQELYRNQDPTLRDPYTGISIHAGAHMHSRDVFFPELEDERIVAEKVSQIITKQQKEAADLRAMSPAARTVGYENVSSAYDYMADDHTSLAEFGTKWLMDRGYPAPPAPTELTVADEPALSVDHQISMHEQALQDAILMRRTERSSTVRGMLLWAATTTTHHLSVLRTLDRDVDLGRKTTSAMLRLQLAPMGTSTASASELIEQYITEERELFPTPPAPVAQVVVEERIVERIVEKPVVQERIVEKVVEKPVYIDKIVEKYVYVDRPAVGTSRVAGQRQITRARARRPAK